MRSRKKYISDLIVEFVKGMLPSLAAGEFAARECLIKAKIEGANDGFPLEFQLCRIFDAAWIWAQAREIDLPVDTCWDLDFKEFCDQLMASWQIDLFEKVGLKVRLTHRSNRKEFYRYELTLLRKSNPSYEM